MRHLNEHRFRHKLARVAQWYKHQGRKRARVDAMPPLAVVRDMLAEPDPPLPVLTRLVHAPIFAPDGSLELEPGYHEASRIYYVPVAGFRIPPLPNGAPSAREVADAKTVILDNALVDFPFVGESERAHAIALLILPFVRELIAGPTPLHLIEKPGPGTGGTLLAEALLHPATGQQLAVMTEGRDEDEWRKRLTAKLRLGPVAVVIDNLRRRLESSALSSAITALIVEDRILGQSEMVRLPVRCVWTATGNNPAVSNEIARRTVRIRLDAKVDRPWLRDGFCHPDLRQWIAEERGALVWAALVLALAWIAEGRPLGSKKLGMFEDWSQVIGGILEVARIPGFLANAEEFYEASDAELAAWRTFVSVWWEKYRDEEVGVGDLWKLVNPEDGEPIDLDLGKGNERSQRTRFGILLTKQRDRQFDGFRIEKAGTKHRSQLWRLRSVNL